MATYGMGELVERQARRWEKSRQDAKQKASKPSIAIARLPYSGATELAQKVGVRLDFGVFGHQIVDEIAGEEGVNKSLVVGLDEHVESAIERHVLDGFRRQKFTESDYLRDVVRIVTTLGLRGQTIVLGRGATCVLPPENTLRVLVVAPADWRRARFAQLQKTTAEEAATRLAREDSERAEFWKHHFGVQYTDCQLYDIVVNTGTLTIDGAVNLVADAFKQRFPG